MPVEIFFATLLLASTGFAAKEKIVLSRTLILESCQRGVCKPIEGKSIELAEKELILKNNHAEDKIELLVGKAPFRGELVVDKVRGKYKTQAVLRSGNGKDKSTVTMKGAFDDAASFKPVYLTDKPVSTGEKKFTGVRARFIVKNAAVDSHLCESYCKFRNKNGAYAREQVRATGIGFGDAWTEMRSECDRLEKIANGGELQLLNPKFTTKKQHSKEPEFLAATEGNSCVKL